jgi:hypothetical protein
LHPSHRKAGDRGGSAAAGRKDEALAACRLVLAGPKAKAEARHRNVAEEMIESLKN